MGAWGPGHLDNDDAADWLADFEEEPTVAMVTSAPTRRIAGSPSGVS